MMQVELGELFGFGAVMIGACWTLLKVSASQHEKRLDERFKTITDRMDREFQLIYQRTASGDALAKELAEYRLEFANYKAFVAAHYISKAAAETLSDKSSENFGKALDRIEHQIREVFRLLEKKEDRRGQ